MEKTQSLWRHKYGIELTELEASQMVADICEFFSLLGEWDKKAGDTEPQVSANDASNPVIYYNRAEVSPELGKPIGETI